MTDIIIGDEDNFGKKGVKVKVLDVSTLPTSVQDKILYPWLYEDTSDNRVTLNSNPDLNWDKTVISLDIAHQQQSLSKKHLDPKTDVVIKDLGGDYVYGDEHHNVQMLSRTKLREQPKKDVVVIKTLGDYVAESIEKRAKRKQIQLGENLAMSNNNKSHQTIINEIVLNKSNPNDVIVE